MSNIVYFEEIFLKFYNHDMMHDIGIQYQDQSPMASFYSKLSNGQALTQNQANYVVKILEKYKNLSKLTGYDYSGDIVDAQWKTPFRVLDLGKRLYVEKREDGRIEICLKFPYQLKQEFDNEINVNLPGSHRVSHWDHEDKVRRLDFYQFNLMAIYEFAVKHTFEIDESFMCALADVEEIWQTEEKIRPTCYIENNLVVWRNTTKATEEWLADCLYYDVNNNLMLAKSMGFVLEGTPNTLIEKIAATPNNTFWIKSNQDLFNIYQSITGKMAVILDRTSDTLSWLKNFVVSAETAGIDRNDIRVCFREGKDSNTGLNEWIKLAGVGGKVEDGKIFIFEHKPAKWLFKDSQDVKLIVTNNLYPHTSQVTKDWLESHPCVIYLGDIKPSEERGKKIVEL